MLLEHRLVGEYSRSNLVATVADGVRIDSGYAVHEIRFATDGAESWGTVTIPVGDAPPGGWHIAGNQHGTTGIDDPCALHGNMMGEGIAGYFGARGMIGVAVDYPGLGTPGLHPYLVSRSEGAAALDGLRAARELADALRVPTSGRYVLTGLSQGGHATLAAAALHATYAPELDVRAFAVTAPATVWVEQWGGVATTAGWHLTLHAMMFHAWSRHYAWPASVFTPEVAAGIDRVTTTRCMFATATAGAIPEALPHDPATLFDPVFLDEYATGRWDRFAFVRDAFTANRIGPYTQTAPLRIYQGDADEIVPAWTTEAVVQALRAGGNEVDHVVVPGGTHLDVAFGHLGAPQTHTDDAIAWLEAQLLRP